MDAAISVQNDDSDIELARLAAIVASSNDAIVSKDLNGTIQTWNTAAEAIFGYLADEIIGRPITTIIPDDLQSEEVEIISRLKRGERIEHFDTTRLTKAGQRIAVSLTISPIRNARGEIVGASKIARDITERKRNEALQATLINELNHRTKNLLVSVQAIASQTFSHEREVRRDLDTFFQRLKALAVSQDLLVMNEWRGTTLKQVFECVLEPFNAEGKFRFSPGPEVELSLRQTNALTMAIHELATNAAKYGALSVPQGQVAISWECSSQSVVLRWSEGGVPAIPVPTQEGFGTRLIKRALEHELEAQVELQLLPGGMSCTIEFAPGFQGPE